jgi:hypothetical protein
MPKAYGRPDQTADASAGIKQMPSRQVALGGNVSPALALSHTQHPTRPEATRTALNSAAARTDDNNNGQANTVKLILTPWLPAPLDLSGDTDLYDLTAQQEAPRPRRPAFNPGANDDQRKLQQGHLQNLYLNMKSLGVAVHSGKGSIGIYNYAAEQTTYDTVSVLADTPLVLSSQNSLSLTSHYATLVSGNQSDSGMTMVGKVQFISADVGPRIWCDGGCIDVDLGSTYLAVDTGLGTGAVTTQAGILGGSLANWSWHSARQEDNTHTTQRCLSDGTTSRRAVYTVYFTSTNSVQQRTDPGHICSTRCGACPYPIVRPPQIWNSGAMSGPVLH